jgi:hypothetical protein
MKAKPGFEAGASTGIGRRITERIAADGDRSSSTSAGSIPAIEML